MIERLVPATWSVWQLLGSMLIIYGVLLTGVGIYYLFNPPLHIALSYLQPSLWWGLLLLTTGSIFTLATGRQ